MRARCSDTHVRAQPDSGCHLPYRTDHYVRIIGNIKTFQNKRTVTAGHIRAITDFNEVFYHKLDAVHTHLQITRGPGAAGGAGAGAGAVSGEGRGARRTYLTWASLMRMAGKSGGPRGSSTQRCSGSDREAAAADSLAGRSRPSQRRRQPRRANFRDCTPSDGTQRKGSAVSSPPASVPPSLTSTSIQCHRRRAHRRWVPLLCRRRRARPIDGVRGQAILCKIYKCHCHSCHCKRCTALKRVATPPSSARHE